MMTNHSYPTSSVTIDDRSTRADAPGMLAHAAMIASMTVVAAAFAVFVSKTWDVPRVQAGTLGLMLLLVSMAIHVIIAARAVPPAPRSRQVADTVKGRRRRVLRIPDQVPGLAAATEAAADAARPSDLALDLLARAALPQEAAASFATARANEVRMNEGGAALSSLSVRQAWAEQTSVTSLPGPEYMPELAGAVAGMADAEAMVPETELQRVDRLVRRLADQVNGQEALAGARVGARQVHLGALTDPMPPPLPSQMPPAQAAMAEAEAHAGQPGQTLPPLAGYAGAGGEAMVPPPLRSDIGPISDQLVLNLSSAIAALPKWPEPVAEPAIDRGAHERREAVLAALHAQRIDVFLEPILGIADQMPQHYEVSIGLKGAAGEHIDLGEAATSFSGTGLLPLIDTARIAKAAQMARRLAERGKAGAVLTHFSAESLFDRETQDDLTSRGSAGAFPGQLVLMMPQALVRLFAAADWLTLARLKAAGFAFALTDVTTLDMDFGALGPAGFTFARLDAETFLVGLPTSGEIVAPGDICRHIAASGLALIVGGIVDDHQLAMIFGFGVVFGQGQLFGGARAVAG